MATTLQHPPEKPMLQSVRLNGHCVRNIVIPSGPELREVRELLRLGLRETEGKSGICRQVLSEIENEIGGSSDALETLHATLVEECLGWHFRLQRALSLLVGTRRAA